MDGFRSGVCFIALKPNIESVTMDCDHFLEYCMKICHVTIITKTALSRNDSIGNEWHRKTTKYYKLTGHGIFLRLFVCSVLWLVQASEHKNIWFFVLFSTGTVNSFFFLLL